MTKQEVLLVMPEISMEMESMTSLLAQNMEILMVKVTQERVMSSLVLQMALERV